MTAASLRSPDLGGTARGLVALVALVGVGVALHLGGILPDPGGGLFALGFLLLGGGVAGRVAQLVGLPRVTGYLATGVLAGPQGFAVFGESAVSDLSLVNGLALALIALQAGAELTVSTLRRTWKSVVASSIAQVVFVVGTMAVVFYFLAPRISFLSGASSSTLMAISLIWGVLALSRSPSVMLAVLQETKAKGPLTEYALGVIIFLDLVVLVLFTFALAGARSVIEGSSFELETVLHLGKALFASIAAGTTFGLGIALYLRFVRVERTLFIVAASYAITAFCAWFHYETLLVFVVAGFVVMNMTRLGHELVAASEQVSFGVMIVFFATVGATLDLAGVARLWPIAVVLVAVRVASTFVATSAGALVARDPPVVRRYGFLTLTSQAGVGIALATIVRDQLPGYGADLASLAIAVVAMNEVFGPAGFKLALGRAGEIPARNRSTTDESASR